MVKGEEFKAYIDVFVRNNMKYQLVEVQDSW